MKNTLALVLMVFGLVGCATNYGLPQDTSETTMERARYCQVSNINKYWGDCWIQRSKQEVAFFEWIDVLEMEQDWELLTKLNSELLGLLAGNKISTLEANNYFDELLVEIDEIVNLRITNRVADAQRKREAWGRALGNLGAQMQENSRAWNQSLNDNKSSTGGIKSYLRSQTVLSDGRRSCVYGVGATQEIIITRIGGRCPNSI